MTPDQDAAQPIAPDGSMPSSEVEKVAAASAGTITAAQLQSLSDGIDQVMTALQARIEAEVLAETLPLIGDTLEDASKLGKAGLSATLDLSAALTSVLNTLSQAASQTATTVETELNAALSSLGYVGSAISVTIDGDEVRIALDTASAVEAFVQELAPDLGLGQLGAVAKGVADVATAFSYALDFATDANGFFVDTSAATDIGVEITVSGPSFSDTLTLAGQEFVAADVGSTFTGSIGIDLQATGDRMGAAATATLEAQLNGQASLGFELDVAGTGDFTPPIGSVLVTDWTFDNALIDPSDTNIDFGDLPEVRFSDVAIDLGTFMEDVAGPLLEKIDDLLEPVRPILNVLDASIKLLEDFPGLNGLLDTTGDGRVTLLDLVKMALPSIDFTAFETVVELARDVADWAEFLTSTGFAEGELILGEFDLGSADIRLPDFDLTKVAGQFAGLADNLDSVLTTLTGTGWGTVDVSSGDTGLDVLMSMLDDPIFGLPVLQDPSEWMNLLLGQAADLVTLDLPVIEIGTGQITFFKFPIFLGIFVEAAGEAAAQINLDFGFDTRGLITDGLEPIDGLYIVDDPDDAEITLLSSVYLGVEFNAVVASISGGGDVEGVIDLDLKDIGSVEGKLYWDEFSAAFTANPFGIFDASGSITAGFSAVIDSVFGEIWRWDSPRITLGNFGFDDPGGFSNLAEVNGTELLLHTGTRADQRALTAMPIDVAEFITITPALTGEGYDVTVAFRPDAEDSSILSHTERYEGFTTIRGNGREGNDQFAVDPDMTLTVDFSGGAGDDVLAGGAGNDTLNGGEGRDALFGEDGDDSLSGGAEDDLLVGGAGADTLSGGDGKDRVSYILSPEAVAIYLTTGVVNGGHAVGDVLSSIEDVDGSIFDDFIRGADAAGSFFGFSGNDRLEAGSGVQYLHGNDGNDTLTGTTAGDILSGGEGDDVYIVKSEGILLYENHLGEIAEGSDSGFDWIQGWVSIDLRGMDNYIEKITLLSDAESVYANDLDNTIFGNAQDNSLFGYGGGDSIYAGGGDDHVSGMVGDDSLSGGLGNDTLYGGLGNDTLIGLDGNDSLFGQDDDDSMKGGAGLDTLIGGVGADTMSGGSEADFFIVDSLDTVLEAVGQGIDYVFAEESHSFVDGQEIEVLSLYDWNNLLIAITLAQTTGNYDGLTAAIWTLGSLGAGVDSDLTGNDFGQLIIAELGDQDGAYHENQLEGLEGADTLIGDGRLDTVSYLQSGAGVQIDLGSDQANTGGDAEGDVLYGLAHVIGSNFDDTIIANVSIENGVKTGNNLLEGREGNDSILGQDGDDTLKGSIGNDTLNGGDGFDLIYGGEGNDSLIGEGGEDTLNGGAGQDTLNGGLENDFYVVTTGDRVIDSGGLDTVLATEDYILTIGAEIERLAAQTTGDGSEDLDLTLYGNTFAQTIVGNAGNNTLHGGAGADTIDGGAGIDDASYTLSGTAVDVDLNRTAQLGGHAEGDVLVGIENLRGSIFGDTLIGHDGVVAGVNKDNEHFGNKGNDYIEDAFGENTLHGGLGDDTLVGSGASFPVAGGVAALSGGHSLLLGGNGNDSLDGGISSLVGGDTLAGGLGDDTYRVTSLGDVVDENWNLDIPEGESGGIDLLISDVATWDMGSDGQAGIENAELGSGVTLLANALDNFVTGNALDNDITGREGDDTLEGREGNDTLRGGLGNDNLKGGLGDDLMIGWAGDDLYIVGSAGDIAQEAEDNGQDTVRASVSYEIGDNIEILVLTGTDNIDGTGNTMANTIIGNDGGNTLSGMAGNDTLEGGAGYDSLDGGVGEDSLLGGDGNDTLLGGSENDTLDGGAGRDLLAGGTGDDFVFGGTEADRLFGGDGTDTLDGGDGGDVLNGGDGRDRLIGGAGDDTITGGDTAGDLRDQAFGGEGNDSIDGGYGNDELRGDAGNDTILGGFGVDNIFGGDGDDMMTGQAWSDLIFGGAGNDFINGGFGFDRVNGGAGADRFYHTGNAGHGSDWIQDYSAADGDKLVFGAPGTVNQFQVNFTQTAAAGSATVDEAFVIYRPTGQILWALIDGGAQKEINIIISGTEYDLLA
jgi:Ca2+-binding RTX toxin-like protein